MCLFGLKSVFGKSAKNRNFFVACTWLEEIIWNFVNRLLSSAASIDEVWADFLNPSACYEKITIFRRFFKCRFQPKEAHIFKHTLFCKISRYRSIFQLFRRSVRQNKCPTQGHRFPKFEPRAVEKRPSTFWKLLTLKKKWPCKIPSR